METTKPLKCANCGHALEKRTNYTTHEGNTSGEMCFADGKKWLRYGKGKRTKALCRCTKPEARAAQLEKMRCIKCGRVDESDTAYCINCGRTTHVMGAGAKGAENTKLQPTRRIRVGMQRARINSSALHSAHADAGGLGASRIVVSDAQDATVKFSAPAKSDSLEERIVLALMKEADIQKQGGYLDVCNRICFNVIPIVRREFRKEREEVIE